MITLVLECIAWSAFGTLFYVYFGYPALLMVLNLFVKKADKPDSDYMPHISLLISCYNEEGVIEEKLLNSLSIDYPEELIEILVISDASTDRTDEIVRTFTEQGIRVRAFTDRRVRLV
ncbi:MAG: glycosyltransferase, partial [Nitrospinota bacterium]